MTFDLPVAPLIQTVMAGFIGWIFKRQEANHKRSLENGERLRVLEVRFGDRMEEFERFRDMLKDINGKMDRMLETITHGYVPRAEIEARFKALEKH